MYDPSEKFSVIPTKGFALRATLIDQPYFIAFLSYSMTVMVCGIGLKIFEV